MFEVDTLLGWVMVNKNGRFSRHEGIMETISQYDRFQLREHLLGGGIPKECDCLVCDRRLVGIWTDLNGQIKCSYCGATYQIISCKISEEYLAKLGISKEQVPNRYADEFELIPLWRAYWQETGKQIPWGDYLGGYPKPEEKKAFYRWMYENIEVLSANGWNECFDLDGIRDRFSKTE